MQFFQNHLITNSSVFPLNVHRAKHLFLPVFFSRGIGGAILFLMLCAAIYEYKATPSDKDAESLSVSNNNERLSNFSNKNLNQDHGVVQENGEELIEKGKSLQKDLPDHSKKSKKGKTRTNKIRFYSYIVILSFMRYFSAAFPGFWITCLTAFNPIRNGGKIISTEPAARDSLTCLHGLRVFSLGWVVMVHTYLQVFSIAGKVVALSQRQRHDDCMKSCLRSSLIILNLRLNKCIFFICKYEDIREIIRFAYFPCCIEC